MIVYSDQDAVFRDIQQIKEDVEINIEFARPEHFVPALRGSAGRHVFIDTIGSPDATTHGCEWCIERATRSWLGTLG